MVCSTAITQCFVRGALVEIGAEIESATSPGGAFVLSSGYVHFVRRTRWVGRDASFISKPTSAPRAGRAQIVASAIAALAPRA